MAKTIFKINDIVKLDHWPYTGRMSNPVWGGEIFGFTKGKITSVEGPINDPIIYVRWDNESVNTYSNTHISLVNPHGHPLTDQFMSDKDREKKRVLPAK